MNSTDEQLLKILHNVNSEIDFKNTKHLLSDGLLSSFDILNLVTYVENDFGIEIPMEYITDENFDTLESIAAVIRAIKNDK